MLVKKQKGGIILNIVSKGKLRDLFLNSQRKLVFTINNGTTQVKIKKTPKHLLENKSKSLFTLECMHAANNGEIKKYRELSVEELVNILTGPKCFSGSPKNIQNLHNKIAKENPENVWKKFRDQLLKRKTEMNNWKKGGDPVNKQKDYVVIPIKILRYTSNKNNKEFKELFNKNINNAIKSLYEDKNLRFELNSTITNSSGDLFKNEAYSLKLCKSDKCECVQNNKTEKCISTIGGIVNFLKNYIPYEITEIKKILKKDSKWNLLVSYIEKINIAEAEKEYHKLLAEVIQDLRHKRDYEKNIFTGKYEDNPFIVQELKSYNLENSSLKMHQLQIDYAGITISITDYSDKDYIVDVSGCKKKVDTIEKVVSSIIDCFREYDGHYDLFVIELAGILEYIYGMKFIVNRDFKWHIYQELMKQKDKIHKKDFAKYKFTGFTDKLEIKEKNIQKYKENYNKFYEAEGGGVVEWYKNMNPSTNTYFKFKGLQRPDSANIGRTIIKTKEGKYIISADSSGSEIYKIINGSSVGIFSGNAEQLADYIKAQFPNSLVEFMEHLKNKDEYRWKDVIEKLSSKIQ